MLWLVVMKHDKLTPLGRAIEAAGGRTADLAAMLKITPQALSQWERVPHLRVLDVERLTGVPRHELRPDIYPPPERTSYKGALTADDFLPAPAPAEAAE